MSVVVGNSTTVSQLLPTSTRLATSFLLRPSRCARSVATGAVVANVDPRRLAMCYVVLRGSCAAVAWQVSLGDDDVAALKTTVAPSCVHTYHAPVFFYRAMRCISAVFAVMQCLSVCPSVCPTRSWITSKRINISSKFFHHRVATLF